MNGKREILIIATGVDTTAKNIYLDIAKTFSDAGFIIRIFQSQLETEFNSLAAGLTIWEIKQHNINFITISNSKTAAMGCELILTLGGDGTFLTGAQYAYFSNVPLIGINLGHIGFLTELELDNINFAIQAIIAKDYAIDSRMTLTVKINNSGTEVKSWALNEVSIQNYANQGILEIVLAVDDHPVSAYGCDGILVATPTGSTAYAFSAGGPIVWPELDAILIVPNNAHALFARPMVIDPNSKVTIRLISESKTGLVNLDGKRKYKVNPDEHISITRSNNYIKVIKFSKRPFADTLVEKFNLPTTGWRK